MYLCSEVFINDLTGQSVDVLVPVVLQLLNLVQSPSLLNLGGYQPCTWASLLKDVSQCTENDMQYLWWW